MNLPAFINMEFFVAGLKFHQYEDIKDFIPEGTPLYLDPQPDNEFDPTAVALMYDGYMLGFIPARTGEAKMIFDAVEVGIVFDVIVTRNKPEALVHRRLKVQVLQLDKEEF